MQPKNGLHAWTIDEVRGKNRMPSE